MSDYAEEGRGATNARLIITHMELENFKSYLGVQKIGPFHKSFSSVVGPNGSGKSNVIDAMLFVFGKRANKLRLKKVSELIYNQRDDIDYARVSVYFQEITEEGDSFQPVPGSEFVVTRYAYKAGKESSKYMINDKTSNFTEVTTLLKSHGIDLDHNRFLILQGEVEQISMMKPKGATEHEEGLLEYLEDIIGSNQYIASIDQSAAAVEELNLARAEKLHRVKVVEKERHGLEGPKAEAESYVLKGLTLLQLQGVLYTALQKECESGNEDVVAKKAALTEKLAHETAKLEKYTADLTEIEAEHTALAAEHETVGKNLAKAQKEFAECERKDVKYRSELTHFKKRKKAVAESLEKLKAKKQEAEQSLQEKREEVPRLEKETEKLTAQHVKEDAALDEIYASLKGETAHLQLALDAKHTEVAPHKKKLSELQSAVDVAQAELDCLNAKPQQAARQLEAAEKNLVDARKNIKEKTRVLEEAVGARDALSSRRDAARGERTELTAEETQLAATAKTLRGKVEEARAALQAEQSRSTVLTALMKLKKKTPGIIGRLGDLGAIDDEYDVAVTTACPALNDVVVDTPETGVACIEHLKATKAGRASMIPLSVLNFPAVKLAPMRDTPEGVPRLFDLIRADAAVAKAFYKVLGDTLVAKDMAQAQRVAYGERRYRVVTLAGEVIDASGTMSGGGSKVARGGMKARALVDASPKDLQAHEAELEKVTAALAAVRARLAALTKEEAALEKQLREAGLAVPTLEMDIAAARDAVTEATAQIEEIRSRAGLTPEEESRIAALAKTIAAEGKKLDATAKIVKALEAEVAQLQAQILDVGGPRLRAQKEKVEGLMAQIDANTSAITKAKVGAKSAEKAIAKADADTTAAQAELEDIETKSAATKAEYDALTDEARAVLEAFNSLKQVKDEKDAALEELKQEHDKRKKAVSTIKTVEVDIRNQLEDYERVLKEGKRKGEHWAKKREEAAVEFDDLRQQSMEADTLAMAFAREGGEDDAPEREAVELNIGMLEEEVKKMKPNMTAIAEYKRKLEDYNARVADLEDLTGKRDAERANYDALRKKRLDEFMAGFSVITLKLKEMYQMITLGGDAELELVDTLDPFSEGIVFTVRPPKKSWKNISNLSGGEKTLSSLALVFALHHYKPTPLYVMDEIDAALDFRNVSIVANYIKDRTKNAQFIIISLRNNMFEMADRLVGIYKTNNCTKSITINPGAVQIPVV